MHSTVLCLQTLETDAAARSALLGDYATSAHTRAHGLPLAAAPVTVQLPDIKVDTAADLRAVLAGGLVCSVNNHSGLLRFAINVSTRFGLTFRSNRFTSAPVGLQARNSTSLT
jgi:hypothetical protein